MKETSPECNVCFISCISKPSAIVKQGFRPGAMASLNLNRNAVKATRSHRPLIPSLNLHRSSFSTLSFRGAGPPPPLRRLAHSAIKASFQPSNPETNPPKPTYTFLLASGLFPFITLIALFLSQYYFAPKPVSAARLLARSTVESSEREVLVDEEREKFLEENLVSNPSDVDGLKDLLEIKAKGKMIAEAIGIIEKLMELEPEDVEWPLLKAHIHAYSRESGLAKNGYTEVLNKDPFRVEAYQGLVTLALGEDSGKDLENISEKVEEAMEVLQKENKMSQMRDFKTLFAQIQVLEGRYDTALKVYQELVNEEPRDFRLNLCQDIIFKLLQDSDRANDNFLLLVGFTVGFMVLYPDYLHKKW